MAYCVVCPDIDPLATAAADFFQQLGTGELHLNVILVIISSGLGIVEQEDW